MTLRRAVVRGVRPYSGGDFFAGHRGLAVRGRPGRFAYRFYIPVTEHIQEMKREGVKRDIWFWES